MIVRHAGFANLVHVSLAHSVSTLPMNLASSVVRVLMDMSVMESSVFIWNRTRQKKSGAVRSAI